MLSLFFSQSKGSICGLFNCNSNPKERTNDAKPDSAFLMDESSLKTSNFGLKPGKELIFNCPDLKVGAIDMRDNQGFSHINEIYWLFLDQAHGLLYLYPGFRAFGNSLFFRL